VAVTTGELVVGVYNLNVGSAVGWAQNGSYLLDAYLATGATNQAGAFVHQIAGSTASFSPIVTIRQTVRVPGVAASIKVAAATGTKGAARVMQGATDPRRLKARACERRKMSRRVG
jgi:hypothetical protein